MSFISLEELKTLVEQTSPCVSIYMPTTTAGSETRQNPIRLKNLLRQVESHLQEQYSLRHSEISSLLQPAVDLDQDEFWQNQDEGVAIFLTNGFMRHYSLPLKFEELVVVSNQFHLKPLLPLLTGDGQFYILALNQKQVRFLEATRYRIREVDVPGMPQSVEEALQYDETAKDGQFRRGTSAGNPRSQQAGSFHGQGSPDQDDRKQEILQFFHEVDRVLHPILQDQRAPLVVAGVEYLIPIYQEANTYQHLLSESITENPEVLKPEELHARALTIVEPIFTEAERVAVEHYQEMIATGKTSTDLAETVPAAFYGRVEQLFVAVGTQKWGYFDPEANQIQIHGDGQPGDEDLLNTAAIQTLLNGGTVYAVEPEKIPDAAPLAAVFRY